jgi:hypothetical protein
MYRWNWGSANQVPLELANFGRTDLPHAFDFDPLVD